MMALEADPLRLVGFDADEQLLGEDMRMLPAGVGRPATFPSSPARRRLVGVGATLTGVTLVLGVGLIVVGVVEAISGSIGLGVTASAVGAVLLATHWGWVHVAEFSANALDSRRNRELLAQRRRWLSNVEPYTRWEVSTAAAEDGSITIVTTRYLPVQARERTFTFRRDIVDREVHSGEERGAAVVERAELLRREAAARTAQERLRFETAHDAYRAALLTNADEQERLAAVRAASEALASQINANLRDPPLTE
jgi:hypothetical protein